LSFNYANSWKHCKKKTSKDQESRPKEQGKDVSLRFDMTSNFLDCLVKPGNDRGGGIYPEGHKSATVQRVTDDRSRAATKSPEYVIPTSPAGIT